MQLNKAEWSHGHLQAWARKGTLAPPPSRKCVECFVH